ncbi:hypothetical protein PTE_02133 [Photorhabdus khanii NC19]|uniref:Uncharacterized protein n=4 Tax=Photorhabdus TaxID=29487 RepID=W3V6H3_9GAMM|nr:hypothetical protein PTE_02133 [Photorhabdus khanii NC19]
MYNRCGYFLYSGVILEFLIVNGVSRMDDRDREQLLQQLSDVLVNSPLIPEEKLAMMMMLCFRLLSSTQASAIDMKISDGSILSLKLETPPVKH